MSTLKSNHWHDVDIPIGGTMYLGGFSSGTFCSGGDEYRLPSYLQARSFCEYCGSEFVANEVNCRNCGASKTKECYGN